MRLHNALLLSALALAPAAMAMEPADARHLLVRTGFQPSPTELDRLTAANFDAAVDRIVDAARRQTQPVTPLPEWAGETPTPWSQIKDLDAEQKGELRRQRNAQFLELQAWWLTEMRDSPAPLAERMTLFWTNHFTSGYYDVNVPQQMLAQNQLLRREALGNFGTLLHAIARDPAMLKWLDAGANRKGQPNENFAREVMELFTLGEGHYDEHDVREAARAFTGWGLDPQTQAARFLPKQHDAGAKTILGKTADFDADGVIDLLLAQPATAELIVTKLWRAFVSPTPDVKAVQRLATAFRKDYEIAPLMRALLHQPAFRDPGNYGTLVKSPIELVVGTDRALGLATPAPWDALASASMGQTLFNPPNVKGWPSGEDWLSTDSLLARRQYLNWLLGNERSVAPPGPLFMNPGKPLFDQARSEQQAISTGIAALAEAEPPARLQTALLNLQPVVPPVDGAKPPERLESWLLDPVYQLK